MESIYKNDLDYKILKLLNGKRIIIDGYEYEIIFKNLLLCHKTGDKKYYVIKIEHYDTCIECYINDKIVECDRRITNLEIGLIKLIIYNESKINDVTYRIRDDFFTKKLVVIRLFKTRKIIKKLNIGNEKLISIITKNLNNNKHSFNNNPGEIEFRGVKEIIFLTKDYYNDGKLEKFDGCAQEIIRFDMNFNEINRSHFNFVNDHFLTDKEFDIIKYFCENGMDIEKFCEINKNEIDHEFLLCCIDKYNKNNNIEDEELEKLKVLIKLEGK